VFDPRFVDKCAVRASQILQNISVARFNELGVMSRHVLVVQDDVGVALAANQYL